jgi:SAM-dependent methyltransferase
VSAKIWDERYSGDGFAYGKEPNDWLREQAGRLKPGAKVLCLAEGEGRNAAYLAGLGLDVTAVDQSAVGLAKAQALAKSLGVAFSTVQADLADFDMGFQRWDAIVSIWCHLPSALRRDVHNRACRALKPGGWLILEAYSPEQIALGTGGPKDPDMLASQQELRQELLALEWHRSESLQRQVQEGSLHAGASAVVQLVGRKAGGEDEDAFEQFRCGCS